MKIISFSVWGNDPFYTDGLLKNLDILDDVYTGWKAVVYVDQSVDNLFIKKAEDKKAEVRYVQTKNPLDGLVTRFYPLFEDDYDAMIVRDADSRVNFRGRACVDEWLNSDKGFHCIRDHPEHGVPILGGMWGIKKGCISSRYCKRVFKDRAITYKGEDQDLLASYIWPVVKGNVIVHDRFYHGKNRFGEYCHSIPKHEPLKYGTFVGERIND